MFPRKLRRDVEIDVHSVSLIVISPIRRRRKQLKYVFLSAALVCAILLGGYAQVTVGAVNGAQAFLYLLRDGKVDDAYRSTASAFRTQNSPDAFAQFTRKFPFSSFEGARWTEKRIASLSPMRVTLAGTLTFAGAALPSSFMLVSQSGSWRVAKALVNVAPKPVGNVLRPALPEEKAILSLVRGTMATFGRALSSGNYAELHTSFAEGWKDQISEDELADAFSSLAGQGGLDLAALATATPSFTPTPVIDDQNLLVVQGSYGKVSPLRFDIRYAYQEKRDQWKLAGLYMRLDASGR